MRDFDPMTSFGDDVAATYDDTLPGDESETVECLRALAGSGPVLELAIGTGRIGLPLAASGLRVDGVEQSDAMVARLRAKPGGDQIAVSHLTEDGVFVVEALTPDWLHALRDDQYVDAEAVATDRVTLDIARYDRATQLLDECHVTLTQAGIRLSPIVTRFIWPSEMDLMARIAGLRLHFRWAGWQHEPFESRSDRHVSVYGR